MRHPRVGFYFQMQLGMFTVLKRRCRLFLLLSQQYSFMIIDKISVSMIRLRRLDLFLGPQFGPPWPKLVEGNPSAPSYE